MICLRYFKVFVVWLTTQKFFTQIKYVKQIKLKREEKYELLSKNNISGIRITPKNIIRNISNGQWYFHTHLKICAVKRPNTPYVLLFSLTILHITMRSIWSFASWYENINYGCGNINFLLKWRKQHYFHLNSHWIHFYYISITTDYVNSCEKYCLTNIYIYWKQPDGCLGREGEYLSCIFSAKVWWP